MTVYSEMLQLALASDQDERSVPELISAVAQFHLATPDHTGTAVRLAHNLSYDVTLLRLCRHVGLAYSPQDWSSSGIRAEVERSLAEHLPSLSDFLLAHHP